MTSNFYFIFNFGNTCASNDQWEAFIRKVYQSPTSLQQSLIAQNSISAQNVKVLTLIIVEAFYLGNGKVIQYNSLMQSILSR